jgi:hypothetical protein
LLIQIPQPGIEGFYWIQIEDFIELFNRIYIINDLSFKEKISTKRYLSYWVPGDYIAGSGGPPLDRTVPSPRSEGNEEEEEEEEEDEDPTDPFTDNPMYPFTVSEPIDLNISVFQSDRRSISLILHLLLHVHPPSDPLFCSSSFPLPLLYLLLFRWSVSRIGSDITNPMMISSASYSSLDHRLDACMTYPRAIGFVLLKLSGLKVRVTTFTMKRIIANSEYIQFSNSTSNTIHLPPGRYALVPFTDMVMSNQVLEYCLVIQAKEGTIEYEVNDLIKERPIDDMPSDDEDNGSGVTGGGGGGGLLSMNHKGTGGSSMGTNGGDSNNGQGKCPLLLLTERWEWEEQIEEIANIAIYEQINDLAYILRHLKKDIREMQRERLGVEKTKDKRII